MANDRIGSLHYDIVADTQGFTKGTRVAQREIRELSKIAIDGMRPLDRLGLEFDVLAKLAKSSGAAMDTTAKKFARLGSESEEARAAAEKYTRSLKNQAAAIRASAQGRPLRDKEIAQIKQLEATHNAYQKELRQTKVAQDSLATSSKRATVASFGMGMSIRALTGAFGAFQVLQYARDIAAMSMELEKATLQYEIFTGSQRKANELVSELRRIAAETPLSLEVSQQAVATMLQYGVAADDVINRLRQLGDIAGADREKINRLSLAFGQITAAGRLQGQELRQLVEAGFNPLSEISRKTGEDMLELKIQMEEGKISIEQVEEAFDAATSAGGRFANQMERIASETTSGKLQKAGGQIKEAFVNIFDTSTIGDDIGGSADFFGGAAGLFNEALAYSKENQRIQEQIRAGDPVPFKLTGGTLDVQTEEEKALERQQDLIAERIAVLREEADAIRLGADEMELRDLREQGVEEPLIKRLELEMKELEALKEANKLEDERRKKKEKQEEQAKRNVEADEEYLDAIRKQNRVLEVQLKHRENAREQIEMMQLLEDGATPQQVRQLQAAQQERQELEQAREQRKRAEEERKQAKEDVKDRAKGVKESLEKGLETPVKKLAKDLAEIDFLVKIGALSEDLGKKAKLQKRDEFAKDQQAGVRPELAPSAQRGSRDEYRLIAEMNSAARRETQAHRKTQISVLQAIRIATELSADMIANFEPAESV